MSFSFFKQRPKTPQELVKAIKDSLMAIDSITAAEVKSLEKVELHLLLKMRPKFCDCFIINCGWSASCMIYLPLKVIWPLIAVLRIKFSLLLLLVEFFSCLINLLLWYSLGICHCGIERKRARIFVHFYFYKKTLLFWLLCLKAYIYKL